MKSGADMPMMGDAKEMASALRTMAGDAKNKAHRDLMTRCAHMMEMQGESIDLLMDMLAKHAKE